MKRVALVAAGVAIIASCYSVYLPPGEAGEGKGQQALYANPTLTGNADVINSKSNTSGVPARAPSKPEPGSNALKNVDFPIYVDGKLIRMAKSPIVKNGAALVPVRSVFEEMGIAVRWDETKGEVHAKTSDTQLIIKVGEKTATRNGKKIKMETASLSVDGTVYVPLRFVSAAFGNLIGYDRNSGTISISTKPYQRGKVIYLADGDTIDVKFENGSTKRIRLIGVNTPESTKATGVEPGGKAAAAYSKSRLLHQSVYVTTDKTDDPYGRMLAYIHLENGEFYNASLVSEGHAKVMTIAPNTTWAKYYEDLQAEAKKAKRQLWDPDMYADLDPDVARIMIQNWAEVGITKTTDQLAAPSTKGEFASLLLYFLYPEARLLMTGYKIYEIGTDEDTQKIIQSLKTKTPENELLNNDQMRSLILLGLGLKEDSFAVKVLDDLGLIPELDRPITVAEATAIVRKLKEILPSIHDIERKATSLHIDVKKLQGLKTVVADSDVVGSIEGVLNDLADVNLADKARDAGGWVKTVFDELIENKPTNEEARKVVQSATEKAAELTNEIAVGAYRIFDSE